MLSFKFCEIVRNKFFTEDLRVAGCELLHKSDNWERIVEKLLV